MDINTMILCATGSIVLLDFVWSIVSSRYRQRTGQYVGALAYIILLANLSYVAYRADADMIVFRDFFVSSQLVGAVFVIGYAINIYRTEHLWGNYIIKQALYNKLSDDYSLQCEENDRQKADIARLDASLKSYRQKEAVEMDKHNNRVLANKVFEETLAEVTAVNDTRQAFQLYSLYSMERGPKFETHLHNVCERICSQLSPDEFRVLMQLDAELTNEAGQYFDATNVFHKKNKKDV